MALISRVISALINGVSQKAAISRLDSHAEEQINGLSSITDGVGPRPPMQSIKQINAGLVNEVKFFPITGEDGEQYFGILPGDGTLEIYNESGTAQTVNAIPAATQTYLTESDPRQSFQALNTSGQTIIANTVEVPEMDSTLSATRDPRWMFWVKTGVAATEYRISVTNFAYSDNDAGIAAKWHDHAVDDVTEFCSYTTGASVTDTGVVAAGLLTAFEAALVEWTAAYASPDEYLGNWDTALEISLENSIYTIDFDPSEAGSTTFDDVIWKVSDGIGDQGLRVSGPTVHGLDDLPNSGAPTGFHTKVTGENASADDDYYLTYDGEYWTETIAQGIKYTFDEDTMPVAIVRDSGTGNWDVGAMAWEDRQAGDATTAPDPTFIGSPIRSMAVHANRLVFVTEKTVLMSESDNFLNFWPTTLRQVLDSDPIDLNVSVGHSSKPADMSFAVGMNDELVLWGAKAQAVVSGVEGIFAPRTVSVEVAHYFEINVNIPPVMLGETLYYVGGSGSNRSVWSYQRDGEGNYATSNTSQHVPTYLPTTIDWMTASHSAGALVCGSDADRDNLYVYRTYAEGSNLLQSSWSKWNFEDISWLRGAEFVFDKLYVVTEMTTHAGANFATILEYFDFSMATMDSDDVWEFPISGDHVQELTLLAANYDAATNTTSVTAHMKIGDTIGPAYPGIGKWHGVIGDDTVYGGRVLDPDKITTDNTTTVLIDGEYDNNTTLWIFRQAAFEYTFSPFYLKSRADAAAGQPSTAQTSARVQLQKIRMHVKNAGPFRVEVTPTGRDTATSYYVPGKVGVVETGPKDIPELDTFDVYIGAQPTEVEIKVVNDSPYPSWIVSVEFFCMYHPTHKRI